MQMRRGLKRNIITHVIRTLEWIDDVQKGGEMIESCGYTRHHLSLGNISNKDLNAIVGICNMVLNYGDDKFRITHDMGEIVPQ